MKVDLGMGICVLGILITELGFYIIKGEIETTHSAIV
jgi:hypothetical protein